MDKKFIKLKKIVNKQENTITIFRNTSDWSEQNLNDMNINFTLEPSAFDDVVKTSNADDKEYSNVFNTVFDDKISALENPSEERNESKTGRKRQPEENVNELVKHLLDSCEIRNANANNDNDPFYIKKPQRNIIIGIDEFIVSPDFLCQSRVNFGCHIANCYRK